MALIGAGPVVKVKELPVADLHNKSCENYFSVRILGTTGSVAVSVCIPCQLYKLIATIMPDEKNEAEKQAHEARTEAAHHEREAADAAQEEADAAKRRADEAERESGEKE